MASPRAGLGTQTSPVNSAGPAPRGEGVLVRSTAGGHVSTAGAFVTGG